MKERFFADLSNVASVIRLFEHLPDVHFFVKNANGVIVAANESFVKRMGARTEADLIGKTAFDICPIELAEAYESDDRDVMQTGRDLVDRVELNQAADGAVNWFITSKVALYRRDGSVAGIAGIARDVDKARAVFRPYEELAVVMEHVREHYPESIKIPALARLAGMSLSTFERRFMTLFGMSPRQYLAKYRVNQACERLADPRKSIAQIAQEVGFYDHSALTRHFVRHMGMTPRAYRKRRVKTGGLIVNR
ncbi:MAG: AraC family transcriptional regulator [Kiritimatiellae bacterium]|nr:AraC family transcriptional regulator [Kiritimatiellia bacterium]